MRASVMMHLPALTMTENINRVISSAGSLGIEVRGLYGEGTKAYGNLYQISNRITLGLSESQVIEKLTNVVNQIVVIRGEITFVRCNAWTKFGYNSKGKQNCTA